MSARCFSFGAAVAIAVFLVHPAFAQTVDFNNNRAYVTPADRRVYNWDGVTPLVGTNFMARLLCGAEAASLQPVPNAAPARFRNLPSTDALAGTWSGGTRTLAGFAEGQTVTMTVQVWDSTGGATFETSYLRMESAPFTYTIPSQGAAPSASYIENFRAMVPLSSPPIPGPLAIAETNGEIRVWHSAASGGTLEVSSDLVTWSPVSTQGSPFTDPTAAGVARRFYRVKASGMISRNYVGFYRVNFGPGPTLFANQLRPADDRVVALLPNPPNGTSFFPFRPGTGGYSSLAYIQGQWEGDAVDMRLSPGNGAWLVAPESFTQTFIGEVVLNWTNELPRAFSLAGSAVPQSLPLTGAGGLGFPVAEGDEIYQWNRATGGYVANSFIGGAWEGDSNGDPPTPGVGECFWVRKRAPAAWVQRINQYPGLP